ncbi:hypothetical protein JOC55_002082 [Paenibacillus sacheonensis]|nr:hypothetical protein [Paenibacillus sacheonensis]
MPMQPPKPIADASPKPIADATEANCRSQLPMQPPKQPPMQPKPIADAICQCDLPMQARHACEITLNLNILQLTVVQFANRLKMPHLSR